MKMKATSFAIAAMFSTYVQADDVDSNDWPLNCSIAYGSVQAGYGCAHQMTVGPCRKGSRLGPCKLKFVDNACEVWNNRPQRVMRRPCWSGWECPEDTVLNEQTGNCDLPEPEPDTDADMLAMSTKARKICVEFGDDNLPAVDGWDVIQTSAIDPDRHHIPQRTTEDGLCWVFDADDHLAENFNFRVFFNFDFSLVSEDFRVTISYEDESWLPPLSDNHSANVAKYNENTATVWEVQNADYSGNHETPLGDRHVTKFRSDQVYNPVGPVMITITSGYSLNEIGI